MHGHYLTIQKKGGEVVLQYLPEEQQPRMRPLNLGGARVTFITNQPKINPKIKVKKTFTGMNHLYHGSLIMNEHCTTVGEVKKTHNLAMVSMVIVFAKLIETRHGLNT
jgi:hypothetical protein